MIAYASKTLSDTQRRYCTTNKELLAVVMAIELFRYYLTGRHFTVVTDHASLTWLQNFKEPEGMVAPVDSTSTALRFCHCPPAQQTP